MLHLFVDADGCPVKQEVYRVAQRYGLKVTLVANAAMRIPEADWLELVLVGGELNAADDWIVAQADADDIVIATDIPLAARCLEKGARVLTPTGHRYTANNIDDALINRQISSHLRDLGTLTGGPQPFRDRDRSQFLQRLDETIQAILRKKR